MAKWAGRECNVVVLGVPCYTFHGIEDDDLAALEEAVLRARAGGYRRWSLDSGSGGYSADFPADWSEIKVLQEVAYFHGGALEAHPARHERWIPVADEGPHFRDEGEVPTGAHNWFRPWDVGHGRLTVNWPSALEGDTDLLAPSSLEPQLSLTFPTELT